MGSFLTNVQLKAPGPSHEALDRLVTLVTADAARAGFAVTENAGEADRSVVLVAHQGKNWVGVYDKATEDQAGGHEQLAERLSRDLGWPAVAILVHDSDVLNMRLFDSGRALDSFSNWPKYFEGGEKIPEGNAAAWARIDGSAEKVQSVWDDGEDAEEMLYALAELYGMDPRLALVGFNYLEDAPAESLDQKRVLHFRAGTRPAHEKRSSAPPKFASGMFQQPDRETMADMFRAMGREPPPERVHGAEPGKPFDVPVVFRNEGGESKGVHVLVLGPALDENVVKVVKARVFSQNREYTAEPVKAQLTSGRPGFSFEFPDVPVAAGPANPMSVMQNVTSVETLMERSKHVMTVQLGCEIVETPKEPVPIVVVVAPSEDPDAGVAERLLIGEPTAPRRQSK